MRLLDWQRQIQSRVIAGQCDIEAAVAESVGIDATTRLQVYASAYELRLLDVLQQDFQVLYKALGEAEFNKLACAYITVQPSNTRSIRWFGRYFAGFLRKCASQPGWIAELAAFEWAQGEVFDAADATACDSNALAALAPNAWPTLRLDLHPSVRLLHLQWAVPATWLAISQAAVGMEPVICTRSQQSWVLWRQGLDTHWRSMLASEAKLLELASHGATCAELCAALHADGTLEAEIAPIVAAHYKRWLCDGWVTGLHTD